MTRAGAYVGRAGGELARRRLDGYRRYASLVAEQEAALDGDDMERFDLLVKAIEALQTEMGPVDLHVDEVVESIDAGSGAHGEAVEVLRGAIVRTERIRDRLAVMKKAQAHDIRQATRTAPRARAYLAKEDASVPGPARIDVRS